MDILMKRLAGFALLTYLMLIHRHTHKGKTNKYTFLTTVIIVVKLIRVQNLKARIVILMPLQIV